MKNRLAAFIFSLLVMAGHSQALAGARETLPAAAVPVADIAVKGTVTDKSGKVPGVTVLIEGSNKHTITDENGNYSITVPANGVLVFSIVGYKTQRIPVNSRERVDVTMTEEVRGLDEVVIK